MWIWARTDRARGGQVLAAQIVYFAIFGRTDLRIGVSGTKFHEEIDFGLENFRFPPKSRTNDEKLISKTKKNRFLPESCFRRFGGRQAS